MVALRAATAAAGVAVLISACTLYQVACTADCVGTRISLVQCTHFYTKVFEAENMARFFRSDRLPYENTYDS